MGTQLRSDTLKKLAMFFMLLDHIGGCILERIYLTTSDITFAQKIYDVNSVFRAVGRLAFPIFCYQIAVGAIKTRNKAKHLFFLCLFSLISEIPFDLSATWGMYNDGHQNVFFTLVLGTAVIYIIGRLDVKNKVIYAMICILIVGAVSVVAELMNTDYGAKGVILISVFYLLRNNKYQMTVFGAISLMAAAFIVTLIQSKNMHAVIQYCNFEAYACLAFPLILMDNGERRGGAFLKWFGYIFYPAHLFIIYLVSKPIVNYFT